MVKFSLIHTRHGVSSNNKPPHQAILTYFVSARGAALCIVFVEALSSGSVVLLSAILSLVSVNVRVFLPASLSILLSDFVSPLFDGAA
jgi:hypothetical protein